MAELVLIKAIVGSRAATVLCPNCGRISRQILSKSYNQSIRAELLREYECPLCKSIYRECNSALANNWTSAVLRYNRDADAYNQSVRENYWSKKNTHPNQTQNNSSLPAPKPGVPAERSGIQSLISVQHVPLNAIARICFVSPLTSIVLTPTKKLFVYELTPSDVWLC